MADHKMIAATLAAGLLHARTTHAIAHDQAQMGGRTTGMALVPDEKEAVRLYRAVLAELDASA
jgi:hypothetical protein